MITEQFALPQGRCQAMAHLKKLVPPDPFCEILFLCGKAPVIACPPQPSARSRSRRLHRKSWERLSRVWDILRRREPQATSGAIGYLRATSTRTVPALSCFATSFTTLPVGAFLPTLTIHSNFTLSAVGVASVQNDISVCL